MEYHCLQQHNPSQLQVSGSMMMMGTMWALGCLPKNPTNNQVLHSTPLTTKYSNSTPPTTKYFSSASSTTKNSNSTPPTNSTSPMTKHWTNYTSNIQFPWVTTKPVEYTSFTKYLDDSIHTKPVGLPVQPVTLFDTTPIITTTIKPAEANSPCSSLTPAHPTSSSEGCPQTPGEQLATHYTQSTKNKVILSVLWIISMQPMNLHTLSKLRLPNLFTK